MPPVSHQGRHAVLIDGSLRSCDPCRVDPDLYYRLRFAVYCGLALVAVGFFLHFVDPLGFDDLREEQTYSLGQYLLGVLLLFAIGAGLSLALTRPDPERVIYRRQAIPSTVKQAVWARDGGTCARCGSDWNLQFDHVIPVSKGGGNSVENIQVLCGTCNRSKAARIE